MIRILHTIDTTGPGGAESVFVNLVNGLDRQKFEPTVVIDGAGWVCDQLSRNGITPQFVNSKGSFNLKYLFQLVQVVREKKIDLIQSHLLGANLYSSLAGLICRVPVVSTFHGFVDIHTKEQFSLIKRWILNRGSAKLVFVSDNLKNFYVTAKGFSLQKSVTIYNGVNTSHFKPQPDKSIRNKLGLGPDNILVGSVGNIRPSKGYNFLLEAAKLVVNQYPQFRFVVAGEGSGKLYENLLELRKTLELEKHFFFLGLEPDVSRFMNNLDIFVLPSVSEGFSISTIEAMACGVPVIATRSGGPEEIVSSFENGILVDACNSESIAEYIVELCIKKNMPLNIITNSIAHVARYYSSKMMLDKYASIYDSLL
jgi:glycosyltransferase involved in cell wall biosynthesis